MKMDLKHCFFIVISMFSFIFVFYAAGNFMMFLSMPQKPKKNLQNDSIIWSLLINVVLLSSFMVQHSLMALPRFKQFLENSGFGVISRSIYNLVTSVLLVVLIKYWNLIEVTFWQMEITNNSVMYFFNVIHLFAWSVIYTGCLFMDISEILGVKQVYYSIRKMPDPMVYKSPELQRLYGHIRHPSFSAFLAIFWIFPIMSLDRFLLASLLTAYMYTAWKTDRCDFTYQKTQFLRKSQELTRLH